MMHSPVAVTVAWLSDDEVLAGATSRVASMLPRDVQLPAVAVARVTGSPVVDGSGVDSLFDWLLTIYCFGGRTGPGDEYPAWEPAESCARGVMHAAGLVSDGQHWQHPSGVTIVDADPVSLTRDVDDAGGAVVTITLAIRVAE